MMSKPSNRKWHQVDPHAALKLTGETSLPGKVVPVDTGDLPSQLQTMKGLSSAYLSGYCSQEALQGVVNEAGELALVRKEKDVGKAYRYVFGVSGNEVFFSGPNKDFPDHHFCLAPGFKWKRMGSKCVRPDSTDRVPASPRSSIAVSVGHAPGERSDSAGADKEGAEG